MASCGSASSRAFRYLLNKRECRELASCYVPTTTIALDLRAILVLVYVVSFRSGPRPIGCRGERLEETDTTARTAYPGGSLDDPTKDSYIDPNGLCTFERIYYVVSDGLCTFVI